MMDKILVSARRRWTGLGVHPAVLRAQKGAEDFSRQPSAWVCVGVALLAIGLSADSGLLRSAFSNMRDGASPAILGRTDGRSAAERAMDESLSALSDRLTRAGLTSVDPIASDGRIVAAGRLGPGAMEEWSRIRAWYDSTHGDTILLVSEIEAAPALAAPGVLIAGVWLGESPYLITDRGVRYHEGDVLPEGWRLTALSRKRIDLSRDGERFAISLDPHPDDASLRLTGR